MGRPPILTEEDRRVIDANFNLFPAQIKALPHFVNNPAVTREIIRAYQIRTKIQSAPDTRDELARMLKEYINLYGLPQRFHGRDRVTGFLKYLQDSK